MRKTLLVMASCLVLVTIADAYTFESAMDPKLILSNKSVMSYLYSGGFLKVVKIGDRFVLGLLEPVHIGDEVHVVVLSYAYVNGDVLEFYAFDIEQEAYVRTKRTEKQETAIRKMLDAAKTLWQKEQGQVEA